MSDGEKMSLKNDPGIYDGIPMDAYQADAFHDHGPTLSSGIARTILARSPAHAWTEHPRLNPDFKAEEKTAYDRGSAAHALLLEGDDRMEVIDAADWRKKEAQEARDAARAAGRYPVLRHQYDDVQRMRDAAVKALKACSDFPAAGLFQGKAEQVICWQEGNTWLRIRPDWMSNSRNVLLHYKTTEASAHPSAWLRTMIGMGAEVEIAMYARGNRATGGPSDALSVFLVQENYAPYACSFVSLTPEFMALADCKVQEAIETWAKCLLTDTWPAYNSRIAYLIPPAWVISQAEERINGADFDPEVAERFLKAMYGEK